MILDVLPVNVTHLNGNEECYWFNCPPQQVTRIKPVHEEDNFWTNAYNHIYLISWSSAIIFFILFSLIITLIKYWILKHKNKNTTYKSVLKNSALIYIISFVLSLVVLRMVYTAIVSMNEWIWARI